VKLVLAELPKVDPNDERFEAKMTVLQELIEHHVEEEEEEMFKLVGPRGIPRQNIRRGRRASAPSAQSPLTCRARERNDPSILWFREANRPLWGARVVATTVPLETRYVLASITPCGVPGIAWPRTATNH